MSALIESIEPKYINLESVKKLTTLSKSQIYELMRVGKFPKNGKFKDTPCRVIWLRQEVEAHLDEQFISN